MIFSQIIATGVTNVGAVVIIRMLSIRFPNLLLGIICYLVQCVVIVAVVMLSDFVFFKSHPPKKAVVIYDLRQGLEDLTIILATVQILFSKESTEGVGEESTELKYEERNKSAVG